MATPVAMVAHRAASGGTSSGRDELGPNGGFWTPEWSLSPAEWRARWPRHCAACGGWGGFSHRLADARSGAFQWCKALPHGACHRCGEVALMNGDRGPCRACGWNHDDGVADDDSPDF